jgi:flagellar motility protein MotE (MotC chaperone)
MRSRFLPWLLVLLPLLTAADRPESPQVDEVDKKVLELEAREAALRVLEEDLSRKIEELKELREAAVAAILPKEQQTEEQLQTLIKFYQAMKPKNAARLLEKLPAPLAAKLLSAMQSRSAGKILNVMTTDRAVVISRMMAGRN